MNKNENRTVRERQEHSARLSRRQMLKGAAISLGTASVGVLTPVTVQAQTQQKATAERITEELSFDPVPAPTVTTYETEILVVGSGFAGIPAAITAKDAGKNVLLLDKGRPGYSGCSPFPQCYQFFDAKYGDNAALQTEVTMRGGEYVANLDWYKIYLEESRACWDQLNEWGIYTQYPKASESMTDQYKARQEWEYHQQNAALDRRAKWNELLEKKKIPFVEQTMLIDVIEQNGKVVGAIGLHVPSGTPITIQAKAVILCMGIGSYKNSGYPNSGNSFDHEWIAYRHGIPVTGKEWDHLEATNSLTPSSCWRNYSWGYVENLHATAGSSIQRKNPTVQGILTARPSAIVGAIAAATEGVDPIRIDSYIAQGLGNSVSEDPSDPRRRGNNVDAMPVRNVYGASVGMGIFKNNGIFCGLDDLVGYTGLPGLYVAGDAHASMMYGSNYTPGQGGSVVVSHLQGRRSAKAACSYVHSVRNEALDSAKVASLTEETLAPSKRKKGIDPRWACDVLHGIMAPWWVSVAKNEESLKAALLQVETLRDKVVPVLAARDAHELRLCHEAAHKVLDAEMKLRASLERKESRGVLYRTDYPFRDDKNFLCYITLTRGSGGKMAVQRVPVKESWVGDRSEPYASRYHVRFPGEAQAKGLSEERS